MHISINNIKIDDIDKARIVASSDFKNHIWVSIKSTFKSNQISPLIKENANDAYDWSKEKVQDTVEGVKEVISE